MYKECLCRDQRHSYTQHFFEQRGWTADYFLSQAEKIGSCTQQYMQNILRENASPNKPTMPAAGCCDGPERMEAATKRALQGNHYSYRTIHNILSNNLDKQPT